MELHIFLWRIRLLNEKNEVRNGDIRNVHRISVGKHVGRNWGLGDKIIQYSFSSFGFSSAEFIFTRFGFFIPVLQPLHVSYCILWLLWKYAFMFLWKHIILSAIFLISLPQTILCAGHTSMCVCVCGLICLIACSILTLYNFDSFAILALKFIMSGMM
jgi:hypothetical protein